jgi:hypothetical protein
MTDPHDRERESRETDETRYERALEEEEAERDQVADRLADDALPNREPEDEQ